MFVFKWNHKNKFDQSKDREQIFEYGSLKTWSDLSYIIQDGETEQSIVKRWPPSQDLILHNIMKVNAKGS